MTIRSIGAYGAGAAAVKLDGVLQGHQLTGGLGRLSIQKIFNSLFASTPAMATLRESQHETRNVLGQQYGFHPRGMDRYELESSRHSSDLTGTLPRTSAEPAKRKPSNKPMGTMTRSAALANLGLYGGEDPVDIRIALNAKKRAVLPENFDALSTMEKVKAESAAADQLAPLEEAAAILKGLKQALPE